MSMARATRPAGAGPPVVASAGPRVAISDSEDDDEGQSSESEDNDYHAFGLVPSSSSESEDGEESEDGDDGWEVGDLGAELGMNLGDVLAMYPGYDNDGDAENEGEQEEEEEEEEGVGVTGDEEEDGGNDGDAENDGEQGEDEEEDVGVTGDEEEDDGSDGDAENEGADDVEEGGGGVAPASTRRTMQDGRQGPHAHWFKRRGEDPKEIWAAKPLSLRKEGLADPVAKKLKQIKAKMRNGERVPVVSKFDEVSTGAVVRNEMDAHLESCHGFFTLDPQNQLGVAAPKCMYCMLTKPGSPEEWQHLKRMQLGSTSGPVLLLPHLSRHGWLVSARTRQCSGATWCLRCARECEERMREVKCRSNQVE
jgi:hypothetical protein